MQPGQIEPNEFELAILHRIADEEPSLRDSMSNLHVLGREYTGVGCFTKFRVPESDLDLPRRHVDLPALIRVPTVASGMGAVLFCRGGLPECLELYTYGDEHWSGAYDGFSIVGTA